MSEEREQIIRDFNDRVNMTPKELERWLATEESQNSGVTERGEETKGHESGRWILELLRKNKREYSDDDIAQMRRVRGYINRHLAQRPSGDVTDTTWRYSLMNWGHDPLK